MTKSAYAVLGVAPDADAAAIDAAFSARSREWAAWPDALARCAAARATLLDPAQRAAHDRALAAAEYAEALAATRRPGSLWGVLALGAALLAIAAGALWPRAAARPGAAPPAAPLSTAPQPAAGDEAPVVLADLPAPVDTVLPDLAAPPAEAPPPARQMQRPAKGPGFDPAYMAWSVFLIKAARGRGSGVMVAPDRILTNCHVVAGSSAPRSVQVVHSVTGQSVVAERVAVLADDEDVCLLEAPGAPAYPATLGRSEALEIGARTYTVSYPGGRQLGWSEGELRDRQRIARLDVLLTNNYCRPGVSGGPLFDAGGQVIGLTSAGRRYVLPDGRVLHGECVSVPAEVVRSVLGRALMPIAMVPWRYDGVWGAPR